MNCKLGVRRTKPVNVNGVYNINSNISYSMPVRFLKGTCGDKQQYRII